MELHGTILAAGLSTSTSEVKSGIIHSIEINRRIEIREYFKNENYTELNYPTKRKQDFICTVKHIKKGYYTVLQVKDNEIKELMTSETRLHHPILINNDKDIIFITKDGEQSHFLYNYNLITQSAKRLTDYPVIPGSKPIIIPSDGSIIFAGVGKTISGINYDRVEDTIKLDPKKVIIKSGQVFLRTKNGDIIHLTKGMYPTWYEDGKTFFYYDSEAKKLMLYNLATKSSQIIVQKIQICTQPIVSPDRKYLIFNEQEQLPLFGGRIPGCFLTAMSVDGWTKKGIETDQGQLFVGMGMDWSSEL